MPDFLGRVNAADLATVTTSAAAAQAAADAAQSTANTALAGNPPVGALALWTTASAPTNWLLCDGSSLLRAGTYAGLFAVIGTTYGAVDGTHFTLPDMRGRFPLGVAAAGTGSVLAGTGGTIDHVHAADPPSTVSGAPSATQASTVAVGTGPSVAHTHTVDIASFDTGTANPPFLALNFIIRYA